MTVTSPRRGLRIARSVARLLGGCAVWLVASSGRWATFAGAQDPREPAAHREKRQENAPRQTVTERSPVPTDTTFSYRFRKSISTLESAGGKATLVATLLPAGEREYRSLEAIADGLPALLERSPAIKLRTERPLRFGTVGIPIENVARGYAGVYSLWPRRSGNDRQDGEGWELVFNDEADAWGTQHDPGCGVVERALPVGSKCGSDVSS